MKSYALRIILILFAFQGILHAEDGEGNPYFIHNAGQWEQDFLYKSPMINGDIYFHQDAVLFHVYDPAMKEFAHGHHKGHEPQKFGPNFQSSDNEQLLKNHAYRMKWHGGNQSAEISPQKTASHHHNYFLGNDKKRWKSNVKVVNRLVYNDIYPGIDLRFYGEKGQLKYDFEVEAGADPSKIEMEFEGVDRLFVENGELKIQTSLGMIYEQRPYAYQYKNGVMYTVQCRFVVDAESGRLRFELKGYDPAYDLVIDPTVVFSSFTGSDSDNWGFTATYDQDGNLYAGGMVFGANYPTSIGAFQSTFGGGNTDVTIFKFSPDGTALIYSTFLGGSESEQPHSMVVGRNNELIVMGTTSSSNFPVSQTAYQTTFGGGTSFTLPGYTFSNGSDLFVTRMNANGSGIVGSTYLGGSENDGINLNLIRNYGDYARGEVLVDSADMVYVSSCSFSPDFPTVSPAFGTHRGEQDGVLAKFNANLSSVIWSTFFGGEEDDAAYSVRIYGDNVYIAGGTKSDSLPDQVGLSPFQDTLGGDTDGFIAHFQRQNGNFIGYTYVGTAEYDQIFFIDVNRFGEVHCLGQTKGSFPVTAGKYAQPLGKQFISKFTSDLSTRIWNTNFGNANGDLVSPSAFEVDNCNGVLLSAWGGTSNNPSSFFNNMVPEPNGFSTGLPVTPNAFRSTTDGSDFYFMALGTDGGSLEFGSYYGGTANEHVDGGTSRFSPEGVIYQAVCAACGGGTVNTFPTTPGVYAPNRPPATNCNKAGIKIDFNRTVEASAQIDVSQELDSLCGGFNISFSNGSVNANEYFWDFGNGETSTDFEPTVLMIGPDTFTVMLVAIDTVCNIFDTAYIDVIVDEARAPEADVDFEYDECDPNYAIIIENNGYGTSFGWNFGDGEGEQILNDSIFSYSFVDPGVYEGYVVAYDTLCDRNDTSFFTITFEEIVLEEPEIIIDVEECSDGRVEASLNFSQTDPNEYTFRWMYDGGIENGQAVELEFDESGDYIVRLIVTDTLCGREFVFETTVEINFGDERLFMPNTFTPNNDGVNDLYEIKGNRCLKDTELYIYNRWGQQVFYTDSPFEQFWDGQYEGRTVAQGVYMYVIQLNGKERTGYLHLFR